MIAQRIELFGGPADGQEMLVEPGCQRVIVPVFDREGALAAIAAGGPLLPLPIKRHVYQCAADGRFEHRGLL